MPDSLQLNLGIVTQSYCTRFEWTLTIPYSNQHFSIEWGENLTKNTNNTAMNMDSSKSNGRVGSWVHWENLGLIAISQATVCI